MTDEMNAPTTFSMAKTVLRARIEASGNGYARRGEDLDVLLGGSGILGPAIAQSIHDMIGNATTARMDEESRTGSFFGHLASNLEWFAFVASLTPDDDGTSKRKGTPQPCGLYWASQSRRIEFERGGDFGVALRSGEGQFEIKFYQAKRVDVSGTSSLYRNVSNRNQSDDNLISGLIADLPILGENRNIPINRYRDLHQIHRLETWRQHGITLVNRTPTSRKQRRIHKRMATDWCDYVFWFDKGAPEVFIPAPVTRSCQKLFDTVREALVEARASSRSSIRAFDVEAASGGSDFGRSLLGGAPGALAVSTEQAIVLIGHLHALGLPEFFVIDDGGGDALVPPLGRMFPSDQWAFHCLTASPRTEPGPRRFIDDGDSNEGLEPRTGP